MTNFRSLADQNYLLWEVSSESSVEKKNFIYVAPPALTLHTKQFWGKNFAASEYEQSTVIFWLKCIIGFILKIPPKIDSWLEGCVTAVSDDKYSYKQIIKYVW